MNPQITSPLNTSPNSSAPALPISHTNPTTTSNKIRYPSPSESPKEEIILYERDPMEEELNQSSGSRSQSIIVQERKIESIKDNEVSQVAEINNSHQATGPDNSMLKVKLLAMLEGIIKKDIKEDIKKRWFAKDKCLLCKKNISKKVVGHIKTHIEQKPHVKSCYSFCLYEDGKTLQVECNKCLRIFNHLTVATDQEHYQVCTSDGRSPSNKLGSTNKNGSERLQKEKDEEENKAKEDELTTLKKQVNEMYKVQQTMKEKQDNIDQRVIDGEKNLMEVKMKVENEKLLVGEIKDLISAINVMNKHNESKEKERERERSRERARNGSYERRTKRQGSRDRDQRRWTREDRERSEERIHSRRDKSSEERSQDKRQIRYTGNNKRRQSYRRH